MAIKFLNQLDLTVTSSLLKTDANGIIVAAVAGTDYLSTLPSHTHAISDVTGLQTALNDKAPLASPALTGTPTAPTAATATNTTQIATTEFVKAQGYLTSVTNISGYAGTLLATDDRTIAPSDLTAGRLMFGFTSWANNNTSPYADFLHLRSYTDASGGNDNLVMFRKDAIGMRIWQRAWGNSGAYSSYKDVAFTDSSITGNAATATTLQTARSINGTSFNGSADITTANWGTARTITIGATGKSVNGSGNVSWSLGEIQAEYQVPINTLRNNLGDPTVREMALFHGQFNNKFRFLAPTLQEESTDGTTWVASTRATAAQLGDMMIGEGQGTGFSAIPSGTVGTYGAYRLTWNVVGSTGYVFLNALYIYSSASGNNIGVTIERFHNTTGWEAVTGPHTISNWPGHAYIPHASIPYSNSATQYSQVRVTFTSTHNANTNAFTLYAMEWFGGYPQGRRNAEYYDRDKNVYFPAYVNGSRMVTSAVMADGTGGLVFKTSDGSDRMFLNNSGNFGIGTTTPGHKLEVDGAANSIVASFDHTAFDGRQVGLPGRFMVGPLGSGYPEIGYNFTTSSSVYTKLVNDTAWGMTFGVNNRMSFRYAGAGTGTFSWSEFMSITSAGNVGIGTASPATALDVNGTISVGGSPIASFSGNYNRILRPNGTVGIYLGNATDAGNYYDNTTHYFRSSGGGTTYAVINNLGNVGIGTTAPESLLHLSQASTGGDGAFLFIDNPAPSTLGNTAGIRFATNTGASFSGYGSFIQAVNTNAGNGAESLTFGTWNGASRGERMRILDNGNVGIGTTAPTEKLHVDGNAVLTYNNSYQGINSVGNKAILARVSPTAGIINYAEYATAANLNGFVMGSDDARVKGNIATDSLEFITNGSTRMTVLSSGNVGVNTTTPGTNFHVVGDVLIQTGALGVGVNPNATDGRIDASNDIVAYSSSDRRLKENITPIANALDKVKSLTGVEFDWKPEHKKAHGYEGHDTGVIAQEVQEVMPTAVRTNDTGYLAVRYEKLIGLLIEGMKEQQAQINELKSKLDGITK